MKSKTSNLKRGAHVLSAVIGVLVLLTTQCLAGDIVLKWDASPTTGITNYVLYAHTNTITATNLSAAVVRLNVGTNLTATLEAVQPGRWSFAATAMKDGLESDISNVLNVEVPEPPPNLRTVVIQHSVTLTNFQDVGFFRLRLP